MKQSFTPVRVGRYTLPNRLVMAPMTRSRAKSDGTPGELAAEYYSQRASVGLIVTEGTQPSDDGQGYLVQQFFAPSANTRTDEYGGSIANRARFAVEVATAVAEEIGADRTAIRLSPGIKMWGIEEGAEGPALYQYLVAELDKLGLAYVHILHAGDDQLLGDIRALWKQSLIVNR